jgi:hypothetical protein
VFSKDFGDHENEIWLIRAEFGIHKQWTVRTCPTQRSSRIRICHACLDLLRDSSNVLHHARVKRKSEWSYRREWSETIGRVQEPFRAQEVRKRFHQHWCVQQMNVANQIWRINPHGKGTPLLHGPCVQNCHECLRSSPRLFEILCIMQVR